MECTELRILFAGNPAIAVPALEALFRQFQIVGVLTNPDKPSGRGRRLEMPPVKQKAMELGIPVLQFDHLRSEAREATSALKANFLVSFACGHYFGPRFLSLFSKGTANIHPSLLPKYRGCSPIQFALLNGERETGITVQRIAAEIDSGDVLAQKVIELDGTETSASLSERVALEAAPLIVETLLDLCAGRLSGYRQEGSEATFTTMLNKSDGLIDWNNSARTIHCQIRALQPWPKASTTFEGVPLLISSVSTSMSEAGNDLAPEGTKPGTVVRMVKGKGLAIACADGLLYIDRLQLAQKKEMDYLSFLNGHPHIVGSVLGA